MATADQTAKTGATRRSTTSSTVRSTARNGASRRSAPAKQVQRTEIERRAYELWEAEGRPGGREEVHWYRAEQELAQSRARAPKRTSATAF